MIVYISLLLLLLLLNNIFACQKYFRIKLSNKIWDTEHPAQKQKKNKNNQISNRPTHQKKYTCDKGFFKNSVGKFQDNRKNPRQIQFNKQNDALFFFYCWSWLRDEKCADCNLFRMIKPWEVWITPSLT